ncbi:MAG: hypothetical protein GX289_04685 [Tissierellia bacterium]|nr:hypothetical protein [Tissierellia bacterium]
MNKYDNYIETEISWLKKIPSHWTTFRFIDNVNLRHGFQFRDYDFTDSGLKVIKISQLSPDGYLDLSDCSFISLDRLSSFRSILIKEGDILMALTGGTIGKIIRVGEVNEPLLQNYRVGNFFPKPTQLNKIFTYYLLASQITEEQINYLLNRNGQPNIGKESFKNMFFPQPPMEEQTAIANYLDTKTQAIDKKVSLLEKKIGYYQELRKSLINETVTKGLDKNVKLKDSGIDWIGKIPAHWEVKRIKDIFSTLAGGTPSTQNQEYWIGNIPWIPSGKVQNNDVLIESVEEYISDLALRESSTKIAKKNSVLIALTGATCSNIGYLTFDTTINQSIVALYPQKRNQTLSRFYFYFLMSAKEKIRTYMTGGAQGGINQEDVRFLDIVYPSKEEQEEIVKFLDAKLDTIAKIITNIQAQITTLKELRKTLINDVVTGKIKVSHE